MKILLVGVNAKYVHTNLAIRSLQVAAKDKGIETEICDVTINDREENITRKLLSKKADLIGFSCYIWNIDMIARVTEVLKKSRPSTCILWGGPEVSYDSQKILETYEGVDYIFSGEGEEQFPILIQHLQKDESISDMPCVFSRNGKNEGKSLVIAEDLDQIPFVYTETSIQAIYHKIIYYESMRGCPFNCSYCLSSTLKTVRYRSLEKVFKEIDFFIDQKIPLIKFVDRTFNMDINRTKKIIQHIINRPNQTCFHFEVAGDLFDDELLALIGQSRPGQMQFEVGIQSTNAKTLKAITRRTHLDKIEHTVKTIIAFKNAHVHVDLIAGLPFEDYTVFEQSFNDTIALRPNMLQLGFLKLLKGTAIRENYEAFHYRFKSFAPYEVISNDFLSADELMQLRSIENLVERYYNSGVFYHTMLEILQNIENPFKFFEIFAEWWQKNQYDDQGHSRDQLYQLLLAFLREYFEKTEAIQECLKMDLLADGRRSLPSFMKDDGITKNSAFEYLKDEDFVKAVLPDLTQLTPKQRAKQVFFQYLGLEERKLYVFYKGIPYLVQT